MKIIVIIMTIFNASFAIGIPVISGNVLSQTAPLENRNTNIIIGNALSQMVPLENRNSPIQEEHLDSIQAEEETISVLEMSSLLKECCWKVRRANKFFHSKDKMIKMQAKHPSLGDLLSVQIALSSSLPFTQNSRSLVSDLDEYITTQIYSPKKIVELSNKIDYPFLDFKEELKREEENALGRKKSYIYSFKNKGMDQFLEIFSQCDFINFSFLEAYFQLSNRLGNFKKRKEIVFRKFEDLLIKHMEEVQNNETQGNHSIDHYIENVSGFLSKISIPTIRETVKNNFFRRLNDQLQEDSFFEKERGPLSKEEKQALIEILVRLSFSVEPFMSEGDIMLVNEDVLVAAADFLFGSMTENKVEKERRQERGLMHLLTVLNYRKEKRLQNPDLIPDIISFRHLLTTIDPKKEEEREQKSDLKDLLTVLNFKEEGVKQSEISRLFDLQLANYLGIEIEIGNGIRKNLLSSLEALKEDILSRVNSTKSIIELWKISLQESALLKEKKVALEKENKA